MPDFASEVINIGDANIASHTSTKITITNKSQLPSDIVYTGDTQTLSAKTLTSPTVNSGILSGTFTLPSGNTTVLTFSKPATSGAANAEQFMKWVLSDDSVSYILIENATGNENVFVPQMAFRNLSNNNCGGIFKGETDATNDNGTIPVFAIDGRRTNAALSTRPIFGIRSFAVDEYVFGMTQADFKNNTLVNTVIGSTVTGIVDTNISTHTSTKITITNKSQLNNQIAYKDENDWITNSHVADSTLNWAKTSKSGSTLDDIGDVVLTSLAAQDILYRNGSSQFVNLAKGANNTLLGINGSGVLAYTTISDANIETHTSTKITITNKAQLPSDTVYITGAQNLESKTLNGFILNAAAKTGAYTLVDTDSRIRADATSAAFTLTLPTAVGRTGRIFGVKKIDTTFNIVTVDADASETIDSNLTWELRNPGDELLIISDGANWRTLVMSDYDYNGYRRTGTTAPNRYYVAGMDSQGTFGTAAAVVANTLYAQPFMIGRGGTIDSVAVNVSTAVASSNVRMGIYRNLNGVPGSLVADLGTVATTPAGFREITSLTQKLQPGLYWLAAVFSHTPTVRQIAQANIMGVYGVDNAATTAVGSGYQGSHTFGALPASFPSITVSTAATQPAMFYHFSV